MAMLVAASFCRAQAPEEVWALREPYTENTIVRAVDRDHSLIYAVDSNGVKKLFLYNHMHPLMYYTTIPTSVDIKDMEVYNGWAYFCGQTGGSAIVGQFDIMGVFYSSSQIYTTTVTAGSTASGPYVMVTDATKMDLFVSGNKVYIYAVGEGDHSYDGVYQHSAPTLFHAALNLVTMRWEICADYQKACQFVAFTDIAVSPKYVVVTAVDTIGIANVLFEDATGICNYDFKTYPLDIFVEDLKLRVVAMQGDDFTVALQERHRSTVTFVQLPHLPLPVSTTLTLDETYPSVSSPYGQDYWTLKDLRYSARADKVLLVGKMALPPADYFQPWIGDYSWIGAVDVLESSKIGDWHSVDGTAWGVHFVSSGKEQWGHLMYGCRYLPQQTNCFPRWPVSILRRYMDVNMGHSNHDRSYSIFNTLRHQPTIDKDPFDIICR